MDKAKFYETLVAVFLQAMVDGSKRYGLPVHYRYNLLFSHLNALRAAGYFQTYASPEALLDPLIDWTAANGFENFKTEVLDALSEDKLIAWPALLY